MVNNYNGTLEWNNEMQKLEGTYVINFFNETLTINGKEFSNVETKPIQSSRPMIQITPAEKERIKILSLNALESLHINNTRRLAELETDSNYNKCYVILLFATFTIVAGLLYCCKRKQEEIILQVASPEPLKTTNRVNLNTIPFF